MPATLVYRSSWSSVRPLVYSDDSDNPNVNKLIDAIFKRKKTNRLTLENNKMYYSPSDDYKKVVRLRKIK
jgi:hypothetical protein